MSRYPWPGQKGGLTERLGYVTVLANQDSSQWKWLQPYYDDTHPTTETRYMSLSVGQDDGKLRTDPAPYTLIEGFLQLAAPIVGQKPDVVVPNV